MAEPKRIRAPFDAETVASLKAGDSVLISGTILTGRDAAHKRLFALIEEGKELPIDLTNQVLYYVGPTPAKPGQVIGSAGPTTSGRVDKFTPTLLERGLRGMIGKGYRGDTVKQAIVDNKAVYMVAVGGAAALVAKTIKGSRVLAYEDLGTEAIRELTVEDFPAIVIHDIYGGDLYADGQKQWRQQ